MKSSHAIGIILVAGVLFVLGKIAMALERIGDYLMLKFGIG